MYTRPSNRCNYAPRVEVPAVTGAVWWHDFAGAPVCRTAAGCCAKSQYEPRASDVRREWAAHKASA